MLVSKILDSARLVLADPDKSRWDDKYLIRLLNESVSIFAAKTELLEGSAFVALHPNITTYNVKRWFTRLTRFEYKGKTLPVLARSQINKENPQWLEVIGEPEAIIYDRQDRGTFVIYPRSTKQLESWVSSNSLFGILTHAYWRGYSLLNNLITANSVYGKLIETVDDTNPFINPEESSDLAYINVIGTRKPKPLTLLTDEIDFELIWEQIILYYIVGSALQADMDTSNRAFGKEQLSLFYGSLKELALEESTYHTASTVLQTDYRSF